MLKRILVLSISMILLLTGCNKKPETSKIFQLLDQPTEQADYYRDVVYKKGANNKKLDFNLAIPKDASEDNKKPLVVFLHSGTWVAGDKDDFNDIIYTLSYHGYAAATIDYGLVPDENMMGQVDNAIDSIEYIVKNYSDKGIDKDKVVIMGASAGGHIAILAAQKICDDKESYDFNLSYLVDMFGPSDLRYYDDIDEDKQQQIVDLSKSIEYFKNNPEYLLGNKNAYYEEELSKVNPIEVVDKNLVKTLVISGNKDKYVPIEISKSFYNKLKKLGVDAQFIEVDGVGHDPLNEEIWKEIYDVLKGKL